MVDSTALVKKIWHRYQGVGYLEWWTPPFKDKKEAMPCVAIYAMASSTFIFLSRAAFSSFRYVSELITVMRFFIVKCLSLCVIVSELR